LLVLQKCAVAKYFYVLFRKKKLKTGSTRRVQTSTEAGHLV